VCCAQSRRTGETVKRNQVLSAVCGLCMVLAAAGCSSPQELQVLREPHAPPTPPGKTAVLRVHADEPESTVSLGMTYGSVKPPTPYIAFAHMVAHMCRENTGLEVIPPHEVDRLLKRKGIEPTLQPEGMQVEEFAKALGCDSYLTGRIEQWRYRYSLFGMKAFVRYELECRVPDRPGILWKVRADYVREDMSERDAAVIAIRDTFRALVEQGLVPRREGP